MARYDRVDETVLHAPPASVWEALRQEFCGETHWWLPELAFRPLNGTRAIVPGASVEVVPAGGRTRQRRSPFAFVSRAVDVVENERLGTEYVAGAFRGTGEWTLEPAGRGTCLRMHWRVRTSGRLATLVARFLDLGEQHSRAMQAGFARLSERLDGERRPRPGSPTARAARRCDVSVRRAHGRSARFV